MNNMPSVSQMFKLIVFLILALIVVGLVAAIIKALMPVLVLAAVAAGAYYMYTRWQENNGAV